jgi:hypothetical protein
VRHSTAEKILTAAQTTDHRRRSLGRRGAEEDGEAHEVVSLAGGGWEMAGDGESSQRKLVVEKEAFLVEVSSGSGSKRVVDEEGIEAMPLPSSNSDREAWTVAAMVS